MANLRMGELRPDTWLRPANLPGPHGDDDLTVVCGPLAGGDPAALAAQLWPLDAIAARADALRALVEDATPALEARVAGGLAGTIELSAAVVRFLRAEPLLPPALTSQPWPPDDLRAH
jgi:phenylacetic acid degradation operon negative regulatory protein